MAKVVIVDEIASLSTSVLMSLVRDSDLAHEMTWLRPGESGPERYTIKSEGHVFPPGHKLFADMNRARRRKAMSNRS